MYLMYQSEKVLHRAENGTVTVVNPKMLPFSIQKDAVTIEDLIFWIDARAMNVGRTNAKALLTSLHIPLSNYAIAMACRGLSTNDCYWLCGDDEQIEWGAINPFTHYHNLPISSKSLLGIDTENIRLPDRKTKIHTPEITMQGVASKCIIRKGTDLWLYKISDREVYASRVLDLLIPQTHVPYSFITDAELKEITTPEKYREIKEQGLLVSECKLFTSSTVNFVNLEDIDTFYATQDINIWDDMNRLFKNLSISPYIYNQMCVVDYLIGNTDRHGQNWGFIFTNANQITSQAPLFDHDNSFLPTRDIKSQVTGTDCSMEELACMKYCDADIRIPSEREVMALDIPEQYKEYVIHSCNTLLANTNKRSQGITMEQDVDEREL